MDKYYFRSKRGGKNTQEEVVVKESRRKMPLEYLGNPIRINPVVLLYTGVQVSCLKQSVFEQLKLPISILKKSDVKILAANGTPLENLGTIELKATCRCYI